MDIVIVAACIVAAFMAALVDYGFHREPRHAAGLAVALLVALLIFAAGPRALGG